MYERNKSAFYPLQHPVIEWCRYMRRTTRGGGGVQIPPGVCKVIEFTG